MFRKGVFTIESNDGAVLRFDGYTDGRLWNGFACPGFTEEVYRDVLRKLGWRKKRGFLYVIRDREGNESMVAYLFVEATDGGKALWFPCGWVWSEEDSEV